MSSQWSFDDLRAAKEIVRTPSAKVRHDARPTSQAAATKVFPRTGCARWRVLDELVAAAQASFYEGGLTDDELCARLNMPANTERPRRVELVDGGWVEASDLMRLSLSGNPAICWKATERALLEFSEAAKR